jgi:DNA-binding NarL/FixJ family response regulator
MPQRYVNAAETLPPDVLEAVVEALDGRSSYMWIPARKNVNRRGRDGYVVRLNQEGLSVEQIADRLLISERTVWRILAKDRAHRAPFVGGPDQRRQ